MITQKEDTQKVLVLMEAERRLVLMRSFAKFGSPVLWLNVLIVSVTWLLAPQYTQLIFFDFLLLFAAILCTVQPVAELKGLMNLWTNILVIHFVLISFAIPILMPEAWVGMGITFVLDLLILGLFLGSKKFLSRVWLVILAFAINLLIGYDFANHWFIRLDDKLSALITPWIGTFLLTIAAGTIYAVIKGQESLYQEAILANLESQKASQAKSAFLATMSHEIRTPMNAVIGMTSLLLDTELTSAQREFTGTIRSSGDALLSIINNILDFSKIEAGHIDLENKAFDLRECLEEAVNLLANKAIEKGIELSCLVEPDVPMTILGDENYLRQILLNLLSNSLKFTDKGEVNLVVTRENALGMLHFVVSDTGVGIPADRMNRLFKSFSQADSTTTRKYGGTGLGLAISKRLSELMGGTMWVESEGVSGRGSAFHFTIHAEAAQAPLRQFNEYKDYKQVDLSNKRVLIVDDNKINRRIMDLQTQSWNMESLITDTPFEALQAIQRGEVFDVALIDYEMPKMDGLSLIREIRKLRDEKSLPVILVSSIGAEMVPVDEKFSFLLKPIRASQLYNALVSALSANSTATNIKQTLPAVRSEFDPQMGKRLPLRILLVEDHITNQQLAILTLERLGYQADVAANGLEAISALERQTYDVVLMDMQMPEMDGLEATQYIRQHWPGELGPRIIAMTANVTKEDYHACLDAGMNDYLAKPIRVKELIAALNKSHVSLTAASIQPSPEPALPPNEKPSDVSDFDPSAIDQLLDLFQGDRSALAKLVQSFLIGAPSLLLNLHRALEVDDLELLRRTAHTLKSSARDFGAMRLSQLSQQLEALAKEKNINAAIELVLQIEEAYLPVQTALEELLAGAENV